MSSPSSFKIDNSLFTNRICYSQLIRNPGKQKSIVIFKESLPEYFDNQALKTYIDTTGTFSNVTWDNVIETEKYYEIEVSHINSKFNLLLLVVLARFIFEGSSEKYSFSDCDKFYKVSRHYLNLISYFPDNDPLKLICFAQQLTFSGKRYFTSTHSLGRNVNMIETKDLNLDSSSLFSVFEREPYNKNSFEDCEKIDSYSTKEDYQTALELFMSHNPTIKFNI